MKPAIIPVSTSASAAGSHAGVAAPTCPRSPPIGDVRSGAFEHEDARRFPSQSVCRAFGVAAAVVFDANQSGELARVRRQQARTLVVVEQAGAHRQGVQTICVDDEWSLDFGQSSAAQVKSSERDRPSPGPQATTPAALLSSFIVGQAPRRIRPAESSGKCDGGVRRVMRRNLRPATRWRGRSHQPCPRDQRRSGRQGGGPGHAAAAGNDKHGSIVALVAVRFPWRQFRQLISVAHEPRPAAARLAIKPATQPALNPASMLTTLTPAAQLLSMASNAASPPKLAP